ncbi:MAG TPA: D-glycerate dehydrogenase, partial [Chitinophagaceae bacterium]|nr:D-glycerate dehydrogenase [Chitinophagaceae bacterium]
SAAGACPAVLTLLLNTKAMKVFITRRILDSGLQVLEKANIQYTQWTGEALLQGDALAEQCQHYDALLNASGSRIDAPFLQASRHLKVIALHSVGYDNVDIAAATALKIPVGNTPGVLSNATADTAFLLLLATSRKAFYLNSTIARGEWKHFEPTANLGIELYGKTLGIAGLGKIGYEMARRCQAAYGMKIIYHNRHVNPQAEKDLSATLVTFDALLQQSDVISVHTALTEETKEMFNAAAFAKMKPGAIFINTARGGIHNEQDLIAALQQNIIWGAGLDVTNPEPMLPNNPLLRMPNVAVLPHIGSATFEARSAMSRLAAENIVAGLQGRPLPHWVNPF